MSELASEPARSTSRSWPSVKLSGRREVMRMRQIEWEREDVSFFVVAAVERCVLASSMNSKNSSAVLGFFSSAPTNCMVPNASSFTVIWFRSARRSGGVLESVA